MAVWLTPKGLYDVHVFDARCEKQVSELSNRKLNPIVSVSNENEKKSTEIGKIGSPAICQNICSFPILKKSRTFKEISDCLRQSRNKANRKMNEYIWSSFIRMTLMLWIEQNVDVSTLHSSCKGGQHSKSYLWIWIGILMLRDVVKKQTEVIWWNFWKWDNSEGTVSRMSLLDPWS